MFGMNRFLNLTWNRFGLGSESGRGSLNPSYIKVPALLSTNFLAATPKLRRGATLTNPLIFIGNFQNKVHLEYAGQYVASAPSLSIVVGEYGFGKTELIHQLCHFLRDEQDNSFLPLPINLSSCREHIEVLDRNTKPTTEDFSTLIFNHLLLEAGIEKTFIFNDLVPVIRNGNLLLILDGLDELLSTTIHYRNFFSGLINFLCNDEHGNYGHRKKIPLRFKVVICVRLEFLRMVDTIEAKDLVNITLSESKNTAKVFIYFLNLDALDDSRIECYIQNTVHDHELFYRVAEHPKLLEVLRRPLLLRIFCDLVRTREISDFEELLRIEHAGELLEIFVNQAATDKALHLAQESIAPFGWSIDQLASESLGFYQDGKTEMSISDIRKFIEPGRGNRQRPIDDDEVLLSVHKCPFLKRVSDNTVTFSHRSFFEFFIAKGVALELHKNNRKPFDEIVLNVDTRKFLRYLVNKRAENPDIFDELTKGSYGLLEQEEWCLFENLSFDELEIIRRDLLLSMTEPESPPTNTEELIRRFLQIESWGLHPRFLLYSYEAVAVFLRDHQWNESVKDIDEIFYKVSRHRLEESLNMLYQRKAPIYFQTPLKLLIERILDIGHRLRYHWARDYTDKSKRRALMAVFDSPNDEEILERIKAILRRIEHALL